LSYKKRYNGNIDADCSHVFVVDLQEAKEAQQQQQQQQQYYIN
jgi:hypothetical protein